MSWKIAVVVILGVGMALAHAGDSDTDLRDLQGGWLVLSLTEKNKKVPPAEADALNVVVAADVLTVREKGKVIAQYRFKLNPGRTPKAMDVTHLIGKEKGKKNMGIYGITKNFLRISLDETGLRRPTSFVGDETRDCSVIVLKRKPS